MYALYKVEFIFWIRYKLIMYGNKYRYRRDLNVSQEHILKFFIRNFDISKDTRNTLYLQYQIQNYLNNTKRFPEELRYIFFHLFYGYFSHKNTFYIKKTSQKYIQY